MNTDKTPWDQEWEDFQARVRAAAAGNAELRRGLFDLDLQQDRRKQQVDRVCYYGKEDGEPR